MKPREFWFTFWGSWVALQSIQHLKFWDQGDPRASNRQMSWVMPALSLRHALEVCARWCRILISASQGNAHQVLPVLTSGSIVSIYGSVLVTSLVNIVRFLFSLVAWSCHRGMVCWLLLFWCREVSLGCDLHWCHELHWAATHIVVSRCGLAVIVVGLMR